MTTVRGVEVKPCPFCDGTSIFPMQDKGLRKEFFLCCVSCGADGPRAESEAFAVLKWNER